MSCVSSLASEDSGQGRAHVWKVCMMTTKWGKQWEVVERQDRRMTRVLGTDQSVSASLEVP